MPEGCTGNERAQQCARNLRTAGIMREAARLIATPHTAGLTLPAIEHQSLETVAQAGEILKGRAPKGAVNAEHWKRKELLKR